MATNLAPGARVLIRDAEWIVKRTDRTGTGGYSLQVVGVSEIVRHKEARFLTEIEGKSITVLDPAETELVTDTSQRFENTLLFLESLFRQSPPTGDDLWIGHRGAIDDLPYQLEPALQALGQTRARILIADGTGLGKTIEVGILLSELINRGKGKRILVVATKSMMAQFQKEMWARFTIPLVRLDSQGLDRIRTDIPTNANPFHYYDKSIISIDTLKQMNEYRVWLERSYWDVIVIDEAQNVAFRGSSLSMRARLAKLLAHQSDTLIMASATPHDGKPESFASLMNMLNPTAIADPKNYGPDDIKGLFLRRHKKDIQDQIADSFPDRQVFKTAAAASAEEEAAFEALSESSFVSFDRNVRTGQLLFKTVLEKALFSSPAAALATVNQRIRKLATKDSTEAKQDLVTLNGLSAAFSRIDEGKFSKYKRLVELLRPGGKLQWDPSRTDDRIVLFTERVETLKFLEDHLVRDLRLKANQVKAIHGTGVSDVELQGIVEAFGRDDSPIRLLLATDIASEGLNLHHLCHKLIHFDIPWSLMVFQQRNGRVDRYGQERSPLIHYLYTEPQHPKIQGDLRILELLIEKDAQASKNIGDPSVFQGVFDAAQEEEFTARAIEEGSTPEQFNQRLEQSAQDDLLALLMGDTPPASGASARERCNTYPSLFPDDFHYVQQSLLALNGSVDLQPTFDTERALISLTINQDLKKRVFRALPKEAFPDDSRLLLTTDRRRVKQSIRDSRAAENTWPAEHLLWDLHPIVQWLNFRLMIQFGRRQAPVVRLMGGLQPQETQFLIQGEIPNRKGQPVVHEWFTVGFRGQAFESTTPLAEFLQRTGLGHKPYPNSGAFSIPPAITGLLPEAVDHARQYMSLKRKRFEERYRSRIDQELQNLSVLQDRQLTFLEMELPDDASLVGQRRNKKLERKRHIDEIFRDHRRYVEDSLTTEDSPFLRVAAVFIG